MKRSPYVPDGKVGDIYLIIGTVLPQMGRNVFTYEEIRGNARITVYPDGTIGRVVLSNRAIFRKPGFVTALEQTAEEDMLWAAIDAAAQRKREEAKKAGGADPDQSRARSKARARRRVYDLARCGDFDLFVTVTFDPEKVPSRAEFAEVVKKMNKWLGNRVQRSGLRYLGVPEEHHASAGYHYHFLCNSAALRLVDSGHADGKGHRIYNVPEWRYGFSTAIFLYGDACGAAAYLCKYISKQGARLWDDESTGKKAGENGPLGGRYYIHGGKIPQPQNVVLRLPDEQLQPLLKSDAPCGGYLSELLGMDGVVVRVFNERELAESSILGLLRGGENAFRMGES